MSKLAMLVRLLRENDPVLYKDRETGETFETITEKQAELLAQAAIEVCRDGFASLTPGLEHKEGEGLDEKMPSYIIAVGVLSPAERQSLHHSLERLIDTSSGQFSGSRALETGFFHLYTLFSASNAVAQNAMAVMQANMEVRIKIIKQWIKDREKNGEDLKGSKDQLEKVIKAINPLDLERELAALPSDEFADHLRGQNKWDGDLAMLINFYLQDFDIIPDKYRNSFLNDKSLFENLNRILQALNPVDPAEAIAGVEEPTFQALLREGLDPDSLPRFIPYTEEDYRAFAADSRGRATSRAYVSEAEKPVAKRRISRFQAGVEENLARLALPDSLPRNATEAIRIQHDALQHIWTQLTDEQKRDTGITVVYNRILKHQLALKRIMGNPEAVAKWGREYKQMIGEFGVTLGYQEKQFKESKLPGRKTKLNLTDDTDLFTTIKVLRKAVKATRVVAEKAVKKGSGGPGARRDSGAGGSVSVPETSADGYEKISYMLSVDKSLSALRDEIASLTDSPVINVAMLEAQLNAIAHMWDLYGKGESLEISQLTAFNELVAHQLKLLACQTHAEVIGWAIDFKQALENLSVALGEQVMGKATSGAGNAAALAALARKHAAGSGGTEGALTVNKDTSLQEALAIVVRCCDAVGKAANVGFQADQRDGAGAGFEAYPDLESDVAASAGIRPGAKPSGSD